MADTLSRIVGPVNMGNGTTTIFTGTAAHRYSFRGIRVVNNSAGSITFKLGIGGVTDALLIVHEVALASKATYYDSDLVVLSGTETLQANTSATGLTITVSGVDQT